MSRQRDDGGETVDLRDPRHAEERRARIGLLSAGFSGEPPPSHEQCGVYTRQPSATRPILIRPCSCVKILFEATPTVV